MTVSTTGGQRPSSSGARYTREDALTELQFEQLYRASFQLQPVEDLESQFVLMIAGRLGLRRGEIGHMDETWVNWRKRRIEIPAYVDCDRGHDGDACGSCRQQARQMAEYNEDTSYEEAMENRWEPKTDMAVREVPFDFSARAEIVLQDYFDRFDRWMYSANVINRRIKSLAEIADIDENVYPHSLRATAASFLAGRGMSTLALQAMFGWASPTTARNYVAQSAENTSRELQLING